MFVVEMEILAKKDAFQPTVWIVSGVMIADGVNQTRDVPIKNTNTLAQMMTGKRDLARNAVYWEI